MIQMFKSTKDFITQYKRVLEVDTGHDFDDADNVQRMAALCKLISFNARAIQVGNDIDVAQEGKKRIFYFSMEFLIGPLLANYMLNTGITDVVREGFAEMGGNLDDILAEVVDPGLGNGGLGRLAACFLDSMAFLGIPGHGNGLRYRFGLFKQEIHGGRQVEVADNWLVKEYPWETRRPESAVKVHFGGEVVRHEENGRYWFTTEGGDMVNAVPYDIPIIGYGGKTVNKLRIWSAEPIDADFDLDAFNEGDYAAASRFRTEIEAISAVLYPNDNNDHGRLLRLKQEYFFVAAGLGSIIRLFKRENGDNWDIFPERIAIHTNDTHPALCGPELMRILVDEEGLDWDRAWNIVTRSVSYTNHTVLPEALEQWPIDTFRRLLPRIYMFIEEIDRRYRMGFSTEKEGWSEALHRTAILWDGMVRMANLSIICSHSVNGVAELHTEILKRDTLKTFYELTPEKFNNKTNGISHRRFLGNANPTLSKIITDAIGDGWLANANELSKLEAFKDDPSILGAIAESKYANKLRLAQYVKDQTGVIIDPNSILDVQVKRLHAYKRQLLNIFKVMDVYNRIHTTGYRPRPVTFLFSGKAAQGYFLAKEIIRLIISVADVVNNDPIASQYIRVIFVPNFAVSNAELIYAAAEISEQISTAGMEASGTSNMKLMMNGAITLGTLDGANIEIADLAGPSNIKIFGLRVEEVESIKNGSTYYDAWNAYNNDRDRLGRVVDELTNGTFDRLSGGFNSIHDYLLHSNDQDFVMKDFRSYVAAWEDLVSQYDDRIHWNRMALLNTARSGYFSSDRTICEYARDIWHVQPDIVPEEMD